MSISPELQAIIDKDMAGLNKGDYRRPAMSMNKFIDEFSHDCAQVEIDLDTLVKAGYAAKRPPRNRALLEMLSLAYGERMGTTMDTPEKRGKFDALMALAEKDRKRLGVVAAHVAETCDDPVARRNYRAIQNGSGMVDTCTDNLSLVALVREYPSQASEIRPGGWELTPQYLDEVVARAVELLQLKGIVVDKGIPQNAAVDRQNRILTLCLRAQSEIKKFAYAAFFDNLDYYNANYASENNRAANAATKPAEEKTAVKDFFRSVKGGVLRLIRGSTVHGSTVQRFGKQGTGDRRQEEDEVHGSTVHGWKKQFRRQVQGTQHVIPVVVGELS